MRRLSSALSFPLHTAEDITDDSLSELTTIGNQEPPHENATPARPEKETFILPKFQTLPPSLARDVFGDWITDQIYLMKLIPYCKLW